MNSTEIWKRIDSHPRFEVSNFGNVRKRRYTRMYSSTESHEVPPKDIVPYKSNNGLQVTLDAKQVSVHRLVATAFIPNLENLPRVIHRNGDKTDNRSDNLSWVATASDTAKIAEKYRSLYGTGAGTKILCTNTGQVFSSMKAAAQYFKLSYNKLVYAINRNKEICGYCFKPTSADINVFASDFN